MEGKKINVKFTTPLDNNRQIAFCDYDGKCYDCTNEVRDKIFQNKPCNIKILTADGEGVVTSVKIVVSNQDLPKGEIVNYIEEENAIILKAVAILLERSTK